MPRKITSNERKNGMKYCTFCKPDKIDAIWRNKYLGADDKIQFACADHLLLLKDGTHTPERMKTLRIDSGIEHYTEADYQTWMRL